MPAFTSGRPCFCLDRAWASRLEVVPGRWWWQRAVLDWSLRKEGTRAVCLCRSPLCVSGGLRCHSRPPLGPRWVARRPDSTLWSGDVLLRQGRKGLSSSACRAWVPSWCLGPSGQPGHLAGRCLPGSHLSQGKVTRRRPACCLCEPVDKSTCPLPVPVSLGRLGRAHGQQAGLWLLSLMPGLSAAVW